MFTERRARLFHNGCDQALCIPRQFELEENEAITYKEVDKFIIKFSTRKNQQSAIVIKNSQ